MSARSPSRYTLLVILAVAALALLVALVPTDRGGRVHGGAVQVLPSHAQRSLLDRPTPSPPEGTPEPNVPRTLEDLRAVDENGVRCREGDRRIFVLFHGDAVAAVSHIDEVVTRRGSIVLSLGTIDTRALPLSVLLDARPGTEAVEVWPCQGDPIRIPAKEIRAEPGRWLMVRTPRVFLKVVDRRAHAQRPVVRNVAAVRLLP